MQRAVVTCHFVLLTVHAGKRHRQPCTPPPPLVPSRHPHHELWVEEHGIKRAKELLQNTPGADPSGVVTGGGVDGGGGEDVGSGKITQRLCGDPGGA